MVKGKDTKRHVHRVKACFKEAPGNPLDSFKNLSFNENEEDIPPSTMNGTNGPTMADVANKHECYHEAVQSVDREVKNILNVYLEIRDTTYTTESDDMDFKHRVPLLLREDFCGTAILCREWVSRNIMRTAVGVDLDPDVIKYSQTHVMTGCISDRVHLVCGDVLSLPEEEDKADVVVAFNYGVCYFHKFSTLVSYLRQTRKAIAPGGIFICDIFGGGESDRFGNWSFKRKCSNFLYSFEQSSVDLLTNTCRFSISFKFSDGSCLKNSYNYHFRVWTIAELRDALQEAGFHRVEVWIAKNELNSDGFCSGPGEYIRVRTRSLNPDGSWNAYIVGVPDIS